MSGGIRSAGHRVVSTAAAGRVRARLLRLLVLAGLCVAALSAQGVQAAAADSSVTVDAHDLASGNTLGDHGGFTYLINVDNAHLGNAPDPKNGPMLAPTETFSPIVAEGDQDHATMTLRNGVSESFLTATVEMPSTDRPRNVRVATAWTTAATSRAAISVMMPFGFTAVPACGTNH